MSELGIGPVPLTNRDWVWDHTADRVTACIGRVSGVFNRGLLPELEITLGERYTVAADALARWALTSVRAADTPGLSFVIAPVADGWRLTGPIRAPERHVGLGGHNLP